MVLAQDRRPRVRHLRRRAIGIGAVVVAAFAVFVLVWFQPQKLFIDEKVVEAEPAETVELARGEFLSLDHGTSGVARVIALADGQRFVRVEDLDTSNGPDLYLYVSANPSRGEEGRFDDEFVNLGRLKGNQGDQNYELPAGTDLRRFATVVIWCDRFDSAFGAADLIGT
jgi:hypothetical protein